MSKKRQQLIDAAERIFYKDGFFATGIDAVIERAGTSRRTMYQHFKSKDELVVAALRQRAREYFEHMDRNRPMMPATPRAVADGIARAHASWLMDEGRHGCLFLKALAEYSSHSEKIALVAREHKQAVHRYLTRLLADAGDAEPERAAFTLGILLEGATQYAQVFRIPEVREALSGCISLAFATK